MPGLFTVAYEVCRKDLKIEARTREIATTGTFFAVLVAILASIAFYIDDPKAKPWLGAGTIWISVFFASALSFGRVWQREREESALVGLLVAPIPRAGIFLGKTVGVVAIVTAVEVVVVAVVGLLFSIDVAPLALPLGGLLLLGTIAIAAIGTLFGVMTVRTRARDLVLASVLFPLLSPVLMTGAKGTRELFVGAPLSEMRDYFVLLGAFDVVALAFGIALFGALVED